jgi:dTDP-4-dehydrorhamnose reductase
MSEQKRILIIGGNGFVGTNLARDLSKDYSVICTHRHQVTRLPGVEYIPFQALADKEQCKALIGGTEPHIVIYAVGSNEIALAERETRNANYVHTAGATHLQSASETVKAKFIYLSADMIFSGHGGNYYEGDTTIPNTALGKAKLAAENHVRSRSLNHIVIRSAPLLGRGSLDHPSWVDQLRESDVLGKKMLFSSRLFRNPVHISVLTELMKKVIDQDLKNEIFQIGGLTKISERALADRIMIALGLSTERFETMEVTSHSEPTDYSLNFTRTLEVAQISALRIEESIARLMA